VVVGTDSTIRNGVILYLLVREGRERERGKRENDSERGKEPAKSGETMVKILNPVQTNP